jgi:myo-inositol-1(or 4)-monophosphatase
LTPSAGPRYHRDVIADPTDVAARLALATSAARAAGQLLEAHRGHLREVVKKGEIDLVTEADRAAEAALIERIAAAFPGDAVCGEEGGEVVVAGARWVWYIDPLDGTTNFVHGLPWFAVSVGAVYLGQPTVGVIHAPALGHTWHGASGQGAYLDDRPLGVTATAALKDALLATGFPYDRAQTARALVAPVVRALERARGLRRMGAAALDLAGVADGTFGGYWEPRLKPWDLAAGIALIREAGGRVTDFAGGDGMLASGDVIASNGVLHKALLGIVHGDRGAP